MIVRLRNILPLVGLPCSLCSTAQAAPAEDLFTRVEQHTFQYFWEGAEPHSGLARERIHCDGVYPQHDQEVVTSGGGGFGLMGILVGIENGFISREQGLERLEKVVHFLETCDRFHGAWPHWWEGPSGKVKPFGAKDNGGDLVETSSTGTGVLTMPGR